MSGDQDQPEQDGYSLVIPFIVCTSQGGPYDDDAFVAGFQAGQIWRSLAAIAAVEGTGFDAMVRTELLPQLELIAMHHGFPHIEVEKHEGDWTTWRCRSGAG